MRGSGIHTLRWAGRCYGKELTGVMHRGDVVMYVMCLSRRDASAEDGRKWSVTSINGVRMVVCNVG